MSEETVIRQCAPTLAGIKTGNLFPCPYRSREELTAEIRAVNRVLVPKGMCLLVLRYTEKSALLYLFRPAELQADLRDSVAREVLSEAGYPSCDCGVCIRKLIRRFQENGEFPHEIGLFLSYPPEDVKGFIDNHARNYKRMGLWKVYGDEGRAEALLRSVRPCTEAYTRLWQRGRSLAQLAVAV